MEKAFTSEKPEESKNEKLKKEWQIGNGYRDLAHLGRG